MDYNQQSKSANPDMSFKTVDELKQLAMGLKACHQSGDEKRFDLGWDAYNELEKWDEYMLPIRDELGNLNADPQWVRFHSSGLADAVLDVALDDSLLAQMEEGTEAYKASVSQRFCHGKPHLIEQ